MKSPISNPKPIIDTFGQIHGRCVFSAKQFPDADFVIPIVGNSYKASEGICDGDYAVISVERQAIPGNLVVADTPRDGRRLMRLVEAVSPFLRSDNPAIEDVPLKAEGARIIGVVLGTLRNPVLLGNDEIVEMQS